MALVHVGLGEREAALYGLQLAFEMRASDWSGVRVDQLFAPLADAPRLMALLHAMNLA
jgi:hypothetical protein